MSIKKIPDKNKLLQKIKFNTKITENKNKMFNVTGLATTIDLDETAIDMINKIMMLLCQLKKTTNLNIKIAELENEIPNISGLAITAALHTTATEIANIIPNHESWFLPTRITYFRIYSYEKKYNLIDRNASK